MPLASCTTAATSSCHVDRLRLFIFSLAARRGKTRRAHAMKNKREITTCAAELVIRFGQFFLLAQLCARPRLGHANILAGFVCWFWRRPAVSEHVTRSTAPLTAPEWLFEWENIFLRRPAVNFGCARPRKLCFLPSSSTNRK
jgi:hypothetical protein